MCSLIHGRVRMSEDAFWKRSDRGENREIADVELWEI